jgi:hypothetical protein
MPIPAGPGPTIPGAYANLTDLDDHLGSTPANATQLLIRASRAVDRALLTAVYDPTDLDVIEALKQATLEQVAGTLESGEKTGLGVTTAAPSSFTIGRVAIQRKSPAAAPTTGGLVDQAWSVLQAAGLTGHAPWTV